MRKHKYKKMLISAWTFIVLMAMVGCNNSQIENVETTGGTKNMNSYEQISQEAAKKIMDSETNYIILDVRTKQEYDTGHIPGAICIPNETIGSVDVQELTDKNQLILVYCRSGNRSRQAAEKLVALGYSNIKEFGGINTWPYETE